MTPPLFLVEPPVLAAGGPVLRVEGPEGRHAAAARRLRPGEDVDLGDGIGNLARGSVLRVGPHWVEVRVLRRSSVPAAAPRLVVVQALAKGDRAELAVELLTEVGADEVVPWAAERSVVSWRGERGAWALARWRSTAREAAKQSRRAWLPRITEPADTGRVAELLAGAADGLLLQPAAPNCLAGRATPSDGDLLVVVGPEGGLSDQELALFTAAGGTPVRLGPTVLRTSTAGAVAVTLLAAAAGRLGRATADRSAG